ncbi:hypothetical protein ACHWQZ_G018257 [Mnemiopsis leidyi]
MSLFAGVKREIDVKASIKDQSGKTIKVDLREDEESKEKFGQIIDLLLAAGYFRARISTLPPFDKVVGGLVWCISTCNVDLDVDLLYQENSTIGQKIALTEKIVAVLPRMKCPHELQPHQIQGLDCVKIFPVVQWLVKKAMERREEMAQYIRSFSEMQFTKEYTLPSEIEKQHRVEEAVIALERFVDAHRPNRIYKKPNNVKKLDIKQQTQSTLLEYGSLASLLEYTATDDIDDTEHKGTAEEKEKRREKEHHRKQLDQSNIKALLKTMSSAPAQGAKSNLSSNIGAILQTKTTEMTQVASEYEEKQAEINEEVNKREALISSQDRAIRTLNSQIASVEEMIAKSAETMSLMRESYAAISEDIGGLDNKIEVAKEKIQELEDTHNKNMNISAAEAKQVEKLVLEYDTISKEKEAFTKECKEKVKDYREQMSELSEKIETIEKDRRTRLVQEQYEKDKSKLDKLRLQIAKRNYAISALQRQVDDIPTRIDLLQYQKRFEELHQQTGAVHTETKQFYALFNNLSDTKTYLEKHLVRLNSINENFRKAILNVENGFMFLQQLEQLVEGARQSKLGIEKKRADAKANKDSLNDQYLKLVDEGRRYHAIVQEFQDECKKTEMLVAKCKEMGIKHSEI